jgi:hypothetical protein
MAAPGTVSPASGPAAFLMGVTTSLFLFLLAVIFIAPEGTGLTGVTESLSRPAEETGTGWALIDAAIMVAALGISQAITSYLWAAALPRETHTLLAVGYALPVVALLLLGFISGIDETLESSRGSYYRPLVLIVLCGASYVVPAVMAEFSERRR